jgi:hypothetical protein
VKSEPVKYVPLGGGGWSRPYPVQEPDYFWRQVYTAPVRRPKPPKPLELTKEEQQAVDEAMEQFRNRD